MEPSQTVDSPSYGTLSRQTCQTNQDVHECLTEKVPVIVSGILETWPAFQNWSPESFKHRFGGLTFEPTIDIPSEPEYASTKRLWADYQRPMTMAEFVDFMESANKPCYMQSQSIDRLPGVEADLKLDGLVDSDGKKTNSYFWLGTNTSTGLHFDLRDNLLCQFYGQKDICLIPPDDTKLLYQVADSITKSPIDPWIPDLERYPKFASARVLQGTIHPGEFLFIPKHWWHTVLARDVSLSLFHNFGEKLQFSKLLHAVTLSGPRGICTVS